VTVRVLAFAWAACFVAAPCAADESAGGRGAVLAPFLFQPADARVAGMGEPFLVSPGSSFGAGGSPLSLTRLTGGAFGFTHHEHVTSLGWRQELLGAAFPLAGGMAGLAVQEGLLGTFDWRDAAGDPGAGPVWNDFTQASAGYGMRIGSLSVGGAASFVRAGAPGATGIALHGGGDWRAANGLTLSAGFRNVGGPATYGGWPAEVGVGAAFAGARYELCAEAVLRNPAEPGARLGAEVWLGEHVALRAGGRAFQGSDGFQDVAAGGGLGFRFGSFGLDYAATYLPEWGALSHRMTLVLGPGAVPRAPTETRKAK